MRGRPGAGRDGDGAAGPLANYVNDRPYVASSFLSVAISKVLGSALGGRTTTRPDLVAAELPLSATLGPVRVRGGVEVITRLFRPLGYAVTAEPVPGTGRAPGLWMLTLAATTRLQTLLSHLYVLVPVLDDDKHYWVSEDEIGKLLRHGEGWLAAHPAREFITRRYLRRGPRLARMALEQLAALDRLAELDAAPAPDAGAAAQEVDGLGGDEPGGTQAGTGKASAVAEDFVEARAGHAAASGTGSDGAGALDGGGTEARAIQAGAAPVAGPDGAPAPVKEPVSLNDLRHRTVLHVLQEAGAATVLDLGCGEGKLLRLLLRDPRFTKVTGADVSTATLAIAAERLNVDRMSDRQRERLTLLQTALTYRDARLQGYDAAALVEVVEHMDPARLPAFGRAVFGYARPGTVVLTTPNREWNAAVPALAGGTLRHRDHRFEWTRAEFAAWSGEAAAEFRYAVTLHGIGDEHPEFGHPTQMAVFTCA